MWLASAFDLYRFRARLRLRLGAGGPTLTMLAAERYVEVPTLLRWLAPHPPERLLDGGSARSVVPAYVAVRYGVTVYAVDRWAEVAGQRRLTAALDAAMTGDASLGHESSLLRRILRRPGAAGPPLAAAPVGPASADHGRPALHPVQADLGALPFPDGMFDAALAVSTIEHVPDDGAALRELARVLRPGGALALSVPFAAQARERWRDEPVYDRAPAGGPVFFERVYDWSAVEERLIRPSGFQLEGRAIYAWRVGDRARAERLAVFPLRGLAQLWCASRASVTTPEHLPAAAPAVCCLLLRRPS